MATKSFFGVNELQLISDTFTVDYFGIVVIFKIALQSEEIFDTHLHRLFEVL